MKISTATRKVRSGVGRGVASKIGQKRTGSPWEGAGCFIPIQPSTHRRGCTRGCMVNF
jgi:hypothetical protein